MIHIFFIAFELYVASCQRFLKDNNLDINIHIFSTRFTLRFLKVPTSFESLREITISFLAI